MNSDAFEVCKESADITPERFLREYFHPEIPVVIEGAGSEWSALKLWNDAYIHEKLAQEPSAQATSFWYWMDRDSLSADYETPPLVDAVLDREDVFPRKQHMRLWMHRDGNVSSWHYDENMVSVFNVQVCGEKEWMIVSPETPLTCYPFTNFAVLGDDAALLKAKTYARFRLKQGDLLFLPPLWFHKVLASGEPNISLNWVCTKKTTQIMSRALERELERYEFQAYLDSGRFVGVSKVLNTLNEKTPVHLKVKWRYPEMIDVPMRPQKKWRIQRRY